MWANRIATISGLLAGSLMMFPLESRGAEFFPPVSDRPVQATLPDPLVSLQ